MNEDWLNDVGLDACRLARPFSRWILKQEWIWKTSEDPMAFVEDTENVIGRSSSRGRNTCRNRRFFLRQIYHLSTALGVAVVVVAKSGYGDVAPAAVSGLIIIICAIAAYYLCTGFSQCSTYVRSGSAAWFTPFLRIVWGLAILITLIVGAGGSCCAPIY